jgi:type II secretory pathway component PulC
MDGTDNLSYVKTYNEMFPQFEDVAILSKITLIKLLAYAFTYTLTHRVVHALNVNVVTMIPTSSEHFLSVSWVIALLKGNIRLRMV